MNIIRASKRLDERKWLVDSCLQGPFKDLSDEEFKWITGQSKGTFPLDLEVREQFTIIGRKVAEGGRLGESDLIRLTEIRKQLGQAPRKTVVPQDEPMNEE
jgi:hypothetical protein